jgi:hypothetical protein
MGGSMTGPGITPETGVGPQPSIPESLELDLLDCPFPPVGALLSCASNSTFFAHNMDVLSPTPGETSVGSEIPDEC